MTKEEWSKERFLLNLGFVPKLFGYSDDDLFNLTQGRLHEWTSGVEYYFGLTLKGTERKPEDFPFKLVSHKLIKVIHAPFARVRYPLPLIRRIAGISKESIYRWIRSVLLSRADPNPWNRLPAALRVSSMIGVEKINIHADDIIFAPHADRFFKELDTTSAKKHIAICLENSTRKPKRRKYDKPEWEAAYNPIRLVELIRKHNLENIYLTIDTAHLAASGCNVLEKWEKIKRFAQGDINGAISHFHLVDYIPKYDIDSAPPGFGAIGIDTFRRIIDDLYQLNFNGTISLEVAPLFFYKRQYKLLWNVVKRTCPLFKRDIREEENYILEMIERLI